MKIRSSDRIQALVPPNACTPSLLLPELNHVFPDKGPSMLRAVATMQHANMELARWGEDVEAEKDALLEKVCPFQLPQYLIFFINSTDCFAFMGWGSS